MSEGLASEACRRHKLPVEVIKKMGEMGLMGVSQPTEFGGSGMDTMSYAISLEEISRGCASCGVVMSANNSLYWLVGLVHPGCRLTARSDPIKMFGTAEQKEKWLTDFASGNKLGQHLSWT